MCNVLRKPQKEQFCQNLNIPTGQEAFEAAVVLELSESSFHLDGTVAPKQFSLFGGNIPVRLLAHFLEFPADGNLFSTISTVNVKAKDQSCKAFWLNNSGLFVEACATAPHLLNPGEVHDGPPRRTHSIGDLTQRKKQASLPELL